MSNIHRRAALLVTAVDELFGTHRYNEGRFEVVTESLSSIDSRFTLAQSKDAIR